MADVAEARHKRSHFRMSFQGQEQPGRAKASRGRGRPRGRDKKTVSRSELAESTGDTSSVEASHGYQTRRGKIPDIKHQKIQEL